MIITRGRMSKIAQYLNEHLSGEVTGLSTIRQQYATDGSVLEILPELVVYPKVTNDIRKLARFSWQLAEKGHIVGLTPRGLGTDSTGGAIGSGVIIDTSKYLTDVLYVSSKEKRRIVHVQPGVSLSSLGQVLKWHGQMLAGYRGQTGDMTVGGAIASGSVSAYSYKYSVLGSKIERMEVVLANGDTIETKRISKREVSRKRGEQTLEGEIYRQIEALLEDYQGLIETLSSDKDSMGYHIDKVRGKDGSLDLTPLFIGSQGTLGSISEVILRTDFYSEQEAILAVACNTTEQARDIATLLAPLAPAVLETIDGDYYEAARKHGKRFLFDTKDEALPGAVVYAIFDDHNERIRLRKLRKAAKLLSARNVRVATSESGRLEDLRALRGAIEIAELPLRADETIAAICDGAYVPVERHEEFAMTVVGLAEKSHVKLPLIVNALTGIVSTRPLLHLKKVADTQKVFTLLTEYAELVHKAGGTIAGKTAEGRLNAYAGYALLDDTVIDLYAKIRTIFDPFGTLNPGVKQVNDSRVLARQLKRE